MSTFKEALDRAVLLAGSLDGTLPREIETELEHLRVAHHKDLEKQRDAAVHRAIEVIQAGREVQPIDLVVPLVSKGVA